MPGDVRGVERDQALVGGGKPVRLLTVPIEEEKWQNQQNRRNQQTLHIRQIDDTNLSQQQYNYHSY